MKKIFVTTLTMMLLLMLTGCIQITIESPIETTADAESEKNEMKTESQETVHGKNLYYSVSMGKKQVEDLSDIEKKHMYNYMIDTGKVTVYDFNDYTVKKYGLDRPGQEEEQLQRYGQSIYSEVIAGKIDKNELTDIQKKAMYNYMIDTGKATIYDFNDYAIKKYGLERDNPK